MEEDIEETLVIFRKFRDHGDVIALFPEVPWDREGRCSSYQHLGQHGGADYLGCIYLSTPATPYEYAALKRELVERGYKLRIRKRFNRPAPG